MPVSARSRYAVVRGQTRSGGELIFLDRSPVRFRADRRNRVHVVAAGETLELLAEKYFPMLARAAEFWWVIADYQDPPILDKTILLETGRTLIIPPDDVLYEAVSEARRDTAPLE